MKAKKSEAKLNKLSGRKGSMMHVNIDADPVVYRVAFASQSDKFTLVNSDGDEIRSSTTRAKVLGDEYKKWTDDQLSEEGLQVKKESSVDPWEDVEQRILGHFQSIIVHCNARTWSLFLTGKGNWRDNIATVRKYKAGRQPKPLLYQKIRDYMVDELGAVVYNDIEADDALVIASWDELRKLKEQGVKGFDKRVKKSTVILASIDKDLRQCPGWYYNPAWEDEIKPQMVTKMGELAWDEDKKKLYFSGLKGFYAQILLGDSVDAIPGVKKAGPKFAYELLKDCQTEEELFHKVLGATKKFMGDPIEYHHWKSWVDPHVPMTKAEIKKGFRPVKKSAAEYMTEMGNLLYMLRHRPKDDGRIKLWKAPRKYL